MSQAQFPYKHIAIEGNIGAGKTTLAKLLAQELGSELILEQFSDNPFLSNFYDNPDRHAFSVELFFMAERHKQFQEHFSKPKIFGSSIVVADYIFEKTVLFAKNNLAVLKSNFPGPDLLIYLYRDVEYLIDNIKSRGRDYEQQISPDYLSNIQQGYLNYFKSVEDYPIIVMDIEDLDFTDDQLFLQKIKTRIATAYTPGVHFLK